VDKRELIMITLFCLVVYGLFPSQLGIPVWALFLSLGVDLSLMIASNRKNK